MKKVLFTLCAVLCSVFVASAQFKLKPFEFKVKYRGEVNVGGAFSGKLIYPPQEDFPVKAELASELSRPLIETVHGVMISDYIFVGAGLGFQYYAGKLDAAADEFISVKEGKDRWGTLAIPLFVNLKGFLPINDTWKPFVNLSLGGSVIACSNATYEVEEYGFVEKNKHHGGFYCDFGAGVEYKMWSLGIGLQHQGMAQSCELTDDYFGDTESLKWKVNSNAFYIKLGLTF